MTKLNETQPATTQELTEASLDLVAGGAIIHDIGPRGVILHDVVVHDIIVHDGK